jgi:hypothetical protein
MAETSHWPTVYHQDCVARWQAFEQMLTNSAGNVIDQVNMQSAEECKKNRVSLSGILQAVEYHGCLGLALCGPRGSGDLLPSVTDCWIY